MSSHFNFFFQIVGQSTKKHTSLIFLPSLSHDLNNAVEVFPSFHRHKMSRSNHPSFTHYKMQQHRVTDTQSPPCGFTISPSKKQVINLYYTRTQAPYHSLLTLVLDRYTQGIHAKMTRRTTHVGSRAIGAVGSAADGRPDMAWVPWRPVRLSGAWARRPSRRR